MNKERYYTERYKQLQKAKVDALFGPIKLHPKLCELCNKEFIWEGRRYTKSFEKAKFCSRSCANNRQNWWKNNSTHYRTIAFQHWKKECSICGFDKIVAIHHIDENKQNNNPDNLIPLCPNHHEMVHSKWRCEIQPIIEQLINERKHPCNKELK